MFPGSGNMKVGSLDEELRSEGLKPSKVLDEIERNIRLMEAGSVPVSVSGLSEGSTEDRTLRDRGKRLIEGADQVASDTGERSDAFVTIMSVDESDGDAVAHVFENVDLDELSEREFVEAFGRLKRMASKAVRRAARRGPKYKKKLRMAKKWARRNKSKIKRRMKKLVRRVGGYSALAKKRAKAGPNKRLSFSSRDDVLSNLREELEGNASLGEGVSPYEIAAIQGGYLCYQLGEVFEAMGDKEAGAALFRIADFAADLSEEMEKQLTEDQDDLPEELEEKLQSVMEASSKTLAAWEKLGCPSIWEAMDNGSEDDDEDDED